MDKIRFKRGTDIAEYAPKGNAVRIEIIEDCDQRYIMTLECSDLDYKDELNELAGRIDKAMSQFDW